MIDFVDQEGARYTADDYPLPEGEGNPRPQWGQGVLLPDGRFVSALGDHLGRDGNSWFYEFDPATGALTRTADVAASLGHRPGERLHERAREAAAPGLVRARHEADVELAIETEEALAAGSSHAAECTS